MPQFLRQAVGAEYVFGWRVRSSPAITACSGLALRHLGWKDPVVPAFSAGLDVNGILWERFTAEQQGAEIHQAWPSTNDRPT